MRDDQDLARQVTATLAAYAGTVAEPPDAADVPFDPTRRMRDTPLDIGTLGRNGQGRRRRARPLLLAAVVLVLTGAAATILVLDDGGREPGDDVQADHPSEED